MALADTLSDYFGFEANNTSLRTESLAGLTTFLTMSYIVIVNPAILSNAISIQGYSDGEVLQMLAIVTIISAAVATLVMAVYANRPFAQAPGLGLNAFFAFTVVLTMGIPWQTALAAVVVEGILFIVLTLVGAREFVIKLFPEPVKFAVGTGIGLFLAIIGLENMRVIASSPATFVTFNPQLASDPVAIIATLGLLFTFMLYVRGVRGSIIIGILVTSAVGYAAAAAGVTAPQADNLLRVTLTPQPVQPYYDITPLVGAFITGLTNVEPFAFALIVFTFFFVDFFDTAGTLTGVSQIAGFLDEEGNLPEMDRPLMADAIGTTVGGILGTSTVTTYIESATGVEEGGRTGMTALVVALLFIVSLVLVPVAAAIPLYASHLALVVVAIIMIGNVTDIEWDDVTNAIPAGLTILVMPFTFSIAYGIAAGIISYPLVKAARGDWNAVSVGQWILAALFVVYFAVRTSGVIG